MRGHAKWAFALLAIVFAGSFVFLGVGSGNAGLGDVFSNVFSGGGAPSIEELQERVSERPRDKTALTDLAQALERDGRSADAIAAYRAYLVAKPKDEEILAALALVFQKQAAVAANDANAARARSQPGRSGSAVPSRGRRARTGTRVVRRPARAGSVDAGRDPVPGGGREIPVGQQGGARRLPAAFGSRARGFVGSDPLGSGGGRRG